MPFFLYKGLPSPLLSGGEKGALEPIPGRYQWTIVNLSILGCKDYMQILCQGLVSLTTPPLFKVQLNLKNNAGT